MKVAATRQLVTKSVCQTVLVPSTERSNTISQTTKTPSAIRPAATMPEAREMASIILMNRVMGEPPQPARLFHRQGLIEQMLSVRHVLRKLYIGCLLGESEPFIELRVV